MRNEDNFSNSADFILNQLFVLSYTTELDTIQRKLWCLDGSISAEEAAAGIAETDIASPVNHFASLNNELIFLDRYIRTEEETLSGTPNFSTLKAMRESMLTAWVASGKEAYNMAYSSRPTLLDDSDFEELYSAFTKKREAGELNTAIEIMTKAVKTCFDDEVVLLEAQKNAAKSPSEQESLIISAGIQKRDEEDSNYVNAMQTIEDELWAILQSIEPDLPLNPNILVDGENDRWTESSAVSGYYYNSDLSFKPGSVSIGYVVASESTMPPGAGEWAWGDADSLGYDTIYVNVPSDPDEEPISYIEADTNLSWLANEIVYVNVPLPRVSISATPGDASHKGTIASGEGYRYKYLDNTRSEIALTFDAPFVSSLDFDDNYLETDIEGGYTEAMICHYYIERNNDTGVETTYLTTLVSKDDLPASHARDYTLSRFNNLASRWNTFNQIRENQVQEMGTRAIIEGMIDVAYPSSSIPDLRSDIENQITTKKNMKVTYTAMLREDRSEWD